MFFSIQRVFKCLLERKWPFWWFSCQAELQVMQGFPLSLSRMNKLATLSASRISLDREKAFLVLAFSFFTFIFASWAFFRLDVCLRQQAGEHTFMREFWCSLSQIIHFLFFILLCYEFWVFVDVSDDIWFCKGIEHFAVMVLFSVVVAVIALSEVCKNERSV